MLGGSLAAPDNFVCTEINADVADEGREPQIITRDNLNP